MIPTVQSVAASLTEKATHDLIAVALATPDEKATWQPAGEARPILEQLVECGLANQMWATILRTYVHRLLPEGTADAAYQELDTLAAATARLRESSAQLVTVIKALPDADLGIVIAFPGKPDGGVPVAQCCLHACWNLTYHLGQISYVQTLYGDWDEHCDAGPFGEMPVPS